MPLRKLKRWWAARTEGRRVNGDCADCPLAACNTGQCATVLGVACQALDANRLRTLGVYEGARVSVVDRRSGVLIDVCGTRLALNDAIAASILVRPLGA